MAPMKAIAFNQYGPPEVLREATLTQPEPGPDEVLVKVYATSVNPLDWKMRGKHIPIRRKTGFPIVPGFDVSGVVEQVGAQVKYLKPGDAVFGLLDYRRDGACAEYVRTREAFLHKKPPSLSHEQAAAVPLAALTALQALRLKGKMKSGDKVLVLGASGGVGHFAVQIAAAYGAHVTATCSQEHAKMVKKLGADEVILRDENGGTSLPPEATFDIVFDTVKAVNFKSMVRHLLPKGRYVSTFPDFAGIARARFMSLFGFSKKCLPVVVVPDPHGLKYLYELIEGKVLKPAIEKTFKLNDLAAAHRLSEQGHVAGKLVVKVR